MKHEKTPKGKSGGWKPTKTPNKRAAAITRRLAFLEALHGATKDGWARVSLKELGRSYQTNSSPTYLIDHGILARKHRKYIWLGPKPTKEMAEALCCKPPLKQVQVNIETPNLDQDEEEQIHRVADRSDASRA